MPAPAANVVRSRSTAALHAAAAAVTAFLVLAASARGEDPVAVLVTGPLAAKVGDRVAFEVELVNRSGRPLEKLRVIDYFDRGFHHEASASPIEQKGTIDLAAGTSRRLTLDFLLDEPGRQCHRVEILDQAHAFMGGATSCVQVAASPVAAAPLTTPAPTYPAAPPPLAAAPTPTPTTYPPAMTTPPPIATAPVVQPPVAAPTAAIQPMASPPPLPTVAATNAIAPPASPPSLELDLVGPAEVVSGAIGEFIATVRNTGAVPSGPTSLEFTWDDAFAPQEASDGYKLASSRVSWSLPAIEPGGQARRQINLKAPSAAGGSSSRSCVRAVLSGVAGGVMVADESCVLVRSNMPRLRSPREAGIRVTLADCDDPVVLGHATTLVCTIVNGGSTSSGRLDLTVVLPERATLVGDPSPSRVRIDGSSVTFDSLSSIPPGGQSTVELAYRIPGTGIAKSTAILAGSELDGSVESSCQTTFLAP